ncbi:MAG: rhomboid family intramembrane serine protease [Ignavibacteria bacterium]|nr:rhomboid family intramembrane serine protease [Ignavibacteria bacterium]
MNAQYKRPGFFGFSFFPPVIKFLLITNTAIYLIQLLFLFNRKLGSVPLEYYVYRLLALNPISLDPLDFGFFLPWQLFSYMFLHANFMHLFLNMFALWMFGLELENIWGSKKFLFYYLLCGVGAGIFNLIIPPLFTNELGPTIGASGAVYGILIAFGVLFPNRNIYIYFLIPVKAKYLVLFYMLIEFFYAYSEYAGPGMSSRVAHIAHLGGGVVGLIYLLFVNKNVMSQFFKSFRPKSRQKHSFYDDRNNINKWKYPSDNSRVQYNQPHKEAEDAEYTDIENKKSESDKKKNAATEEEKIRKRIDEILDKLSQKGYDSLSDEEKRILFRDSKKLR